MISIGPSLTGEPARRRAAAAGGDTPTVVLNIGDAGNNSWGNDSDEVPPTDGGYCTKTVTGVGGPFLSSLAILAGAVEPPTYNMDQGIHTLGQAAALTCATPVTIPANADCVIYAKFNFTGGDFFPLGHSAGLSRFACDENGGFYLAGPGFVSVGRNIYPGPGVTLARARRTSNVWTFAMTGNAEAASDGGSLAGEALTFDTLLASASMTAFSSTGNYIQKAKIWINTSDIDTAFELANGGLL